MPQFSPEKKNRVTFVTFMMKTKSHRQDIYYSSLEFGPENIRSAPSYFHMGRVFQSWASSKTTRDKMLRATKSMMIRASYKQKIHRRAMSIFFPDGVLHWMRNYGSYWIDTSIQSIHPESFVELVGTKVIRRLNVLWHSTPRSEHGTLRMVDQ